MSGYLPYVIRYPYRHELIKKDEDNSWRYGPWTTPSLKPHMAYKVGGNGFNKLSEEISKCSSRMHDLGIAISNDTPKWIPK